LSPWTINPPRKNACGFFAHISTANIQRGSHRRPNGFLPFAAQGRQIAWTAYKLGETTPPNARQRLPVTKKRPLLEQNVKYITGRRGYVRSIIRGQSGTKGTWPGRRWSQSNAGRWSKQDGGKKNKTGKGGNRVSTTQFPRPHASNEVVNQEKREFPSPSSRSGHHPVRPTTDAYLYVYMDEFIWRHSTREFSGASFRLWIGSRRRRHVSFGNWIDFNELLTSRKKRNSEKIERTHLEVQGPKPGGFTFGRYICERTIRALPKGAQGPAVPRSCDLSGPSTLESAVSNNWERRELRWRPRRPAAIGSRTSTWPPIKTSFSGRSYGKPLGRPRLRLPLYPEANLTAAAKSLFQPL